MDVTKTNNSYGVAPATPVCYSILGSEITLLGEEKMAYAEIITIEYNDYMAPGFTNVSYESRNIDKDLKYIIMFDPDNSKEYRKLKYFKERLENGETIRLVSDVGACNTRITVLDFYLFTQSGSDDPEIKEWLDDIKERYGDIATDGDEKWQEAEYNKRWPETQDLGCPRGFEGAEDLHGLEYGPSEDDEDDE